MLRTRVIPTLLLKKNGLVKTTKFKNPVYIGDPINAVKIFNDKEVDELILLDIGATLEKRDPNYIKIEEIVSEAFMPIGYGGGINYIQQIETLFKIGIEKVIINSTLFSNLTLIKEASSVFGNQSIVASIDVKKNMFNKYVVYSNSNTKKEKANLISLVKDVQEMGVGEIYINAIDKDGTMSGYDIDLIKMVSENASVPVICAGGARSINDFTEAINNGGASAVSAGAMFVFNGVHRAVLISYPSYKDLEEKLNQEKDGTRISNM